MSAENVELLRAFYAYSESSGNLVERFVEPEYVRTGEQAFGYLRHPDGMEFVLLPGELGERDVYRGPNAIWDGMAEWLSSWEAYTIHAEDFVDLGDRVLVLTREEGRSRSGSVPVSQQGAVVWHFRDGKVTRIETYLRRSTAFEALGLSDPAAVSRASAPAP